MIDEALDANRGETDPAKKKGYAETVNDASPSSATTSGARTRCGAWPTHPQVHGLDDFVTPSGESICLCNGIQGVVNVSSIWVEQ